MQEDLLGYLLGALEPDEMRRVEEWLREDAGGRRELTELERVLKRLEADDEADAAPPVDLVSRTLASLPPLPLPTHRSEGREPAGAVGVLSLSSCEEGSSGSAWKVRDWIASVAAVVILIAITLPVLAEGRFAARKAACQDHLRELGVAMTQFATRNAQSRLPSVAPNGYQAFAGVYAPRLREAGLLDSPQLTFCPSIDRETFWPMSLRSADTDRPRSRWDSEFPVRVTMQTLDELGRELILANETPASDAAAQQRVMAAIEKLRWIQLTAGGQYSYTLGVRDGDNFSSPRFQGRSHFAVMSDAAITRMNAKPVSADRAATPSYHTTVISHGGRGINVLYEDGRVAFLPTESLDLIPDNPLVNHEGLTEAGVTIDDASLAPSWQAPFIRARQR